MDQEIDSDSTCLFLQYTVLSSTWSMYVMVCELSLPKSSKLYRPHKVDIDDFIGGAVTATTNVHQTVAISIRTCVFELLVHLESEIVSQQGHRRGNASV